MEQAVKIFERDVKLFIPWRHPHPEFSCRPYSISVDMRTFPIVDAEGKEHKEFFKIQMRCPLGEQTFAVLALPTDSDLFDFDYPVEFEVDGWVEHAMCGSCLCRPAQLLMDARRKNKPENFKQDWMYFEALRGTRTIQSLPESTETPSLEDKNIQGGSEVSRDSTDYLLLDSTDPNSWKVLNKNSSVPTGDDNGKQG